MLDMNGMVERCADMAGTMMSGGMMGNGIILVVFLALLTIWLVGLAAVGALVFWAARKFREQGDGP